MTNSTLTIEHETTDRIVIDTNRHYTKLDLAKLLGVSPRCIEKRVAKKQLPKPTRLGLAPIWSGSALLDFMEEQHAKKAG